MLQSATTQDTASTAMTPTSIEDNLSSQALEASFAKSEEIKRQGKWLPAEDELLRKYVEEFGEKQWQKISKQIPGRTSIQCLHRWSKILKPGLTKGPWTADEDLRLMAWVTKHGPTQWTKAGEQITGRSGKQCRERWFNSLNPDVKKGGWTPEEDKLIFDLYQKHGSSWSKIARDLPGRSENSVKNRFYSTLRKTDFMTDMKKKIADPSVIDCKRVMTDETNRSTQYEETESKDRSSDDDLLEKSADGKSKSTLYNLLKRSYSEQKVPVVSSAPKKFSLSKPQAEKKPEVVTAASDKPEEAMQEETSPRSEGKDISLPSLSLSKRYNSCKTTANELDEFEKIQKKFLGLGAAQNNLAGGLFGNPLLNSNMFGQGLGGFGMGGLINNPLLSQFKNQENLGQAGLTGFNPSLLMGLNPLSLNLQANALLAAGPLAGFGGLNNINTSALQNLNSLPLQARNSNVQEQAIDEKSSGKAKTAIKEEHDHLSGSKTPASEGQKSVVEGTANLNSSSATNNFDKLLALSNMIYGNPLQSLMNPYASLASMNLNNNSAASLLMRQMNPLDATAASLNSGKNVFQQFPFSAFQ